MLKYRLKNYLLLLVLLFVSASLSAQRKPPKNIVNSINNKAGVFIDVNAAGYAPSNYTPAQLVKDILINGGSTCSVPNVSNVTVTPDQQASLATRFWGYFHKGTTDFPFTDGIVLTTGQAQQAGNVASAASYTIPGAGTDDPDLLVAVPNNSTTDHYNDNVMLEFDFVPNSNQVKFNYLFASEEYTSNYPCQYSDAFALLIRPVSGGPYVNLAVLPNNGGPVAMTNIRPEVTGFGGCGAINEQYFAGYNSANIVTNYNGRTVPLTAVGDVTPGVAYHFKMVLSDYRDWGYDSAVFIEGGSFDIGIKIVDANGVALPSELKMCDNTPQTLVAQVSPMPGMTFQWFKGGTAINGATGATYVATSPGDYEVKVMVPGNNCPASAVITILGGTTPTAQNANLKLCSTPTNSTFNLNDSKPLISTTTGAVFRFYTTQGGAQAQDNTFIPTANLAAYNGTDGQILYVSVSNGAFCSKVVTLTLNKEDLPVAQLNASKLRLCVGESITLTASGGVTYQWGDTTSNTGAVRTLSPTQTTTYTVYAIGAQGCKSPTPATLKIEVVPAIVSDLKGGMICQGDQITLDAGTGPNYSYIWNTGDTSQKITVSTPGAYSVTITNGVCSKTFTTQVIRAIIPEVIKVDYKETGVMTITASNPSNGPLEYSVDNGVTWQNSNVFAGVPRNTVIAIRVRVKNTSCVGFLEYFTFVMQNVITPNGDNVNDMIDFRGISEYKDFKGFVFDRYGKTVFTASKLTPYWDGYFQGKRLPTATYWYQVTFQDPASKLLTVKTGWILLKNIE